MTEDPLEPPTKFMNLYDMYGGKSLKQMGTPCRCKKCGWETKIRLKKGASLKTLVCFNCGFTGLFERFTHYDQEGKKSKCQNSQ